MATLERIYTIPLGDAYLRVRSKRAKRAVAFAKAFALRHMRAKEVRVSEGVNSLIFRDGMKKPPRRIKVRIVKGDDGVAKLWLIGEEEKLKAALDAKKKAEEQKKKEDEEKKKKEEEAKKKSEEQKKPAPPQASAPKPSAAPPAPQKAPAPQKEQAAQQKQPAAPPVSSPAPVKQ